MYKESDRASTLITKIPAVNCVHKSNPYRHRCSKSWHHLILPLYGKSPPSHPPGHRKRLKHLAKIQTHYHYEYCTPVRYRCGCPVLLFWLKNSSNPAPLVDKNRKMTYFPPCITYRISGISRILIKHFLVQCFSNYRSLAVKPITGQNQFSEMQSTFFFF